jgi:3-(3-hydroxy-phenyl)propionate hydroxylase
MRTVRISSPDFTEADGVVARWFEQQHCSAAIVRPDHYVWGVADSAAALEDQLRTLAGQIQQGDNP